MKLGIEMNATRLNLTEKVDAKKRNSKKKWFQRG
jgi:hypothetical protein